MEITVHYFIAVSLRRTAVSLIKVPYVLDDDTLLFLHLCISFFSFEI